MHVFRTPGTFADPVLHVGGWDHNPAGLSPVVQPCFEVMLHHLIGCRALWFSTLLYTDDELATRRATMEAKGAVRNLDQLK